MNVRISRAHYPVTVLGYGRRIGIWVQGCTLACPGCIARDTWRAEAGSETSVEAILDWCRGVAGDDVDGVTISGGEPLEQAEAVAGLLDGFQAWRRDTGRDIDLLCYTGLPWKTVSRNHAPVLERLDAIVPEPYVESLPASHLAGSANQRVIALTDLGRSRYGETATPPARKRIQTHFDGKRVWFIGIPERGDMDRLAELCRERGLDMGEVSWQP